MITVQIRDDKRQLGRDAGSGGMTQHANASRPGFLLVSTSFVAMRVTRQLTTQGQRLGPPNAMVRFAAARVRSHWHRLDSK
jgi:hypothetical protein